MWCFEIKLSRVSVLQFTNIPRILDTSCLHAETDSEVRRPRSASVRDGANHSRHASLTKPAGHEDRVEVAQTILVIVVH